MYGKHPGAWNRPEVIFGRSSRNFEMSQVSKDYRSMWEDS